MKTGKISLANVQGKLSRTEMKMVMAGRDGYSHCANGPECTYYESGTGNVTGTCQTNSNSNCVCKGPRSSIVTSDCIGT
jgi:hypothetical protein